MIRNFKVEMVNQPNDDFVDVFYSFKGLFRTYTDVVSIHIKHRRDKELDGYGLLSKKYKRSINGNKKLLNHLKASLRKKGWKLIIDQ